MTFTQAKAEARRLRKQGIACRILGHTGIATVPGRGIQSYQYFSVERLPTYPVVNAQGRTVHVTIPKD